MLITDTQARNVIVDGMGFHAEVKTIYAKNKRTTTLVLKINSHKSANGRYENIEAMRMLSLEKLQNLLPDKSEPDDRYEARHSLWEIATLYASRSHKDSKNLPPSYNIYEQEPKSV